MAQIQPWELMPACRTPRTHLAASCWVLRASWQPQEGQSVAPAHFPSFFPLTSHICDSPGTRNLSGLCQIQGGERVFAGSKTLQVHGAGLGAGAFTHSFLRVLHEALSRCVCLAKRQVEDNGAEA